MVSSQPLWILMHFYDNNNCIILFAGSPSIVSIDIDREKRKLICVSAGGPATTVTWMKNDEVLDNNVYFQQTQRVIHTANATYENILRVNETGSIVGSFTCNVCNIQACASKQTSFLGTYRKLVLYIIIIILKCLLYHFNRCYHRQNK